MNWPKYVIEYGQAAAIVAIILSVLWIANVVWRVRSRRLRVLQWIFSLAAVFVIYQSIDFLRWASKKVDPLKLAFRTENQSVPDLTFTLLTDGARRDLSDYRGKVLVVNLWATWCSPCREEMPALGHLQQKYGTQGVVVVALTDEDKPQVERFTAFNTVDVVKGHIDPAMASPSLYVRGDVARPITHIIDRNGILRETLVGGQSYASFERAILPYL